MIFSDVYPETVVIHTYKNDEEIEYFTVEDNIDYQTLVNHDFYDIDKIMFEFVKTNPYQRIHLAKIIFGNITDYSIDYRDMSTSPTAVRTDFVKNVNIVYSEYAYGTEVKSISTISAIVGENTYTSNTAHHDYSLAYKEITDDETTYTKVSKLFVDELPSPDDAKTSTRYFISTGTSGQYYMYMVETNDGVKSWYLMATVTETIVSELPSSLSTDTLYLVQTSKNLVYHIYMYLNQIFYRID